MSEENRYSIQEKEIIRVLYFERRPLSILELSQKTGLSWVTAKKYVAILESRGIVKTFKLPEMKTAKTIFNFDLLPRLLELAL